MIKINNNKGFTIIELVITIAILAILITFSIGPIRGLLLRNQVKNEVNLLQLDLVYARSEAINRAYPVVVKPTEVWTDGWEIFVDVNNNGTKDNDEEQLRVTAFTNAQLSLRDSDNHSPLIFTSLGSLKSATERAIAITHSELSERKTIFLAAAGTVSVRTVHND